MKSMRDKTCKFLWYFLDERSRRQDPYVRTVVLNSSEARNSSVWFSFKDDSGCLKRYYAKEGMHLPLVSEVGGFFVNVLTFSNSFSTHWTTHYIYLFDTEDKCVLGIALSSAHEHELRQLLIDIEYGISQIEEEDEDEYYDDGQYEEDEDYEEDEEN